jgi:hypothetical protein
VPPDRPAREEERPFEFGVAMIQGGGWIIADPPRPREEEGPDEENKKATALGRRSAPPRLETGSGEEDRTRFRDYLP